MRRPRGSTSLYFSYTGWTIGIIVGIWFLNRWRLGAYGWMLTKQLVLVGLVTAAATLIGLALAADWPATAALRERLSPWRSTWERAGRVALIAGFAIYAAVALYVLKTDHRLFVIVIALLQSFMVFRLRARRGTTNGWPIAGVSVLTWALASGLSYTHLSDWLVGAGGATAFAVPAFLASLTLVVYELTDDSPPTQWRWWSWPTLLAALVFAAYALRTDHLFADWVPYHRSYFADVAQYVRDGHWLLWDTPSLYGFLSMLTLAWLPTANGYQSVYVLTALFLFGECMMSFTILRWGRRGWVNAVFALALPLAMIFADNVARYPMSVRLYPQGGLRFAWIDALIFIAFLMYAHREYPDRVARLRWAGHAVWLTSLFWSFETGAWASAIWVPVLLADAFAASGDVFRRFINHVVARTWPLLVMPAAGLLLVDAIYRTTLHHRADWLAFVEGAGIFSAGKVRAIFHVQTLGAGWTIALALGALGTLLLLLIARRNRPALVPAVAAWLGVWTTASYFAVEPLDMYVSFLLSVMVVSIAVLIALSRDIAGPSELPAITRLSVAPIAVLAIALAFGSPAHLGAMQLPMLSAWSGNAVQRIPDLPPELKTLVRRAHITPAEPVLFPDGEYWTEYDQGLILPFARNAAGRIIQYRSWLPISPNGVGQYEHGLSTARQQTYIERTLDQSGQTGWYITYRKPAQCSRLSPRLETVRHLQTRNFAAALCRLR